MRSSNAWLLAAGLVSSMLVGRARADAIGPPPTDCPDGARGAACHGAEYCGIDSCIGPRDCALGQRCVARELCVDTVMCLGRGGGASTTRVLADGCAGCAARCESLFVCVGDAIDAGRGDTGTLDAGSDAGRMDAGGGDDPGHSQYCGCAVPSRGAPPPSGWIGLGALLSVTLLRRRSPTRALRPLARR